MKHFETQYSVLEDSIQSYGRVKLGTMASFTWNNDPKRLLFVLSRYKFVASILEGAESVLEIGCGDSFGSRIVAQSVDKLTVSDIDIKFIEEARQASKDPFKYEVIYLNLFDKMPSKKYKAAYLLDVLEHINPSDEKTFLNNLKSCVVEGGKIIIGMPSLESQVHASEASKEGHVNCQTKKGLVNNLEKYFKNVIVFSMNDEVIHTGYGPMAHYIMAICDV